MSRHLVVMAAGTGGHVIAGLAVAREVAARGWSVRVIERFARWLSSWYPSLRRGVLPW